MCWSGCAGELIRKSVFTYILAVLQLVIFPTKILWVRDWRIWSIISSGQYLNSLCFSMTLDHLVVAEVQTYADMYRTHKKFNASIAISSDHKFLL